MDVRAIQLLVLILLGANCVPAFHVEPQEDEAEGIIFGGDKPIDPSYFRALRDGDIESDESLSYLNSPKKWPNGIIPYVFDSNFGENYYWNVHAAVQEIMDDVNQPGKPKCIQFVNRTTESDYVRVKYDRNGCWSYIGYQKGRQDLALDTWCRRERGVILHEFLHALGFYHMQANPDRDQYVSININNVWERQRHNYDKQPSDHNLGLSYDFASVMHYNPYEFAKDWNTPAIFPKDTHKKDIEFKMGQKLMLSKTDVLKIQILYGCTQDSSHITNLESVKKYFCNFEHDLCDWTQYDRADKWPYFAWELASGSSGGGVQSDTTMGTGQYLLAKSNNHNGKTARLVSQNFTEDQVCLDFHVNVNYENWGGTSKIQVATKPDEVDYFTSVRHFDGHAPRRWRYLKWTIDKPSFGTSFQVAIDAYIGTSDVAIDDVYIYPGPCVY